MDLTRIPLEYILKAANAVKKIAYLIAVIGAVTSFGTQVGLLEDWKISFAFSVGIAGTVDLLAVCAAIALQVPGFPWRGRVGERAAPGLVNIGRHACEAFALAAAAESSQGNTGLPPAGESGQVDEALAAARLPSSLARV